MCGITGVWNYDGPTPPGEIIADVLDAMHHRGPDSRGMMEYAGGAAGMVRLALVDLSPRGAQPMWSPCGKVAILFNGEIFNFREERARLEAAGHTFRSTTDTEVILTAFLDEGDRFVHRLRGMFAIAMFDWRGSEARAAPVVTLVRGPFGIKPLYLAEVGKRGETLVFASELRALLASGLVEKRIDPRAMHDYLHYGFVLQPRTMIAGVRMLEPGTIERYEPGKPKSTTRYWTMPPAQPRQETFYQAAARLRSTLEESIRLHAFADAPVGAFLSGGVDSTCIVAMMREHVRDLRTFTFRFPEFPRADEAEQAEHTAQLLECKNTMVDVVGSDVRRLLPEFASSIDQPSLDGLNSWFVSRVAAEQVKGVVSGLGGDEWFAGYAVTQRMVRRASQLWGRAESVAGWAAHQVRNLIPPGRFAQRLEGVAARRTLLSLWLQPHTVFSLSEVGRLTSSGDHGDAWKAEAAELQRLMPTDLSAETPIGLSCLLDVRYFMMCQLLRDADATSMAHSLELRVPFVDLKIAEFSRTCRDDYKLARNGGNDGLAGQDNKLVLKKAVEDLLPDYVKTTPKRGFVMPLEAWMRNDLRELVEETCRPEVVKARGLVDPQVVASLFDGRSQPKSGRLHPRLWVLMIFELWARAVLDSPVVRRRGSVTV